MTYTSTKKHAKRFIGRHISIGSYIVCFSKCINIRLSAKSPGKVESRPLFIHCPTLGLISNLTINIF